MTSAINDVNLGPAMIAVSVVGSISTAVCITFLSYFAFLAIANFAKKRKSQATTTGNTASSTHSELKRIDNQFGALFLQMLVFDLISALGFALTGKFARSVNRPEIGQTTNFCQAQGVLITFGDLASGLFSMFIALHTGVVLGTQYRVSRKLCASISVFLWILAIFLEVIGPLVVQEPEQPYYAFVGIWCFASNQFPLMRLYSHYIFIFASFFVSAGVYIALFFHFRNYYNRSRDVMARNDVLLKTSFSMLLYPLAYAICVMPLALYRMASLAGKTGPPELLAFAGIAFACSGTVNSILYGKTRHLININQVKARLRPGRTTLGDITVRTEQVVVYDDEVLDGEKSQSGGNPRKTDAAAHGKFHDAGIPIELHKYPRSHVVTFDAHARGADSSKDNDDKVLE